MGVRGAGGQGTKFLCVGGCKPADAFHMLNASRVMDLRTGLQSEGQNDLGKSLVISMRCISKN